MAADREQAIEALMRDGYFRSTASRIVDKVLALALPDPVADAREAREVLHEIRETWDAAKFPIRRPSPEYARIQNALRRADVVLGE